MPSRHPALMRAVNRRIYAVLIELRSEDGEFICECSDEDCHNTVQLTLRDFTALDSREDRPPLVASAHPKQRA